MASIPESHGFLVTFEGVEGCGKSTQAQAVARRLETYGLEVTMAREPGGTDVGEVIREIIRKPALQRRLLNLFSGARPEQTTMVPEAELFLFEAARAQLVANVVIPALQAGHVVILDRYTDSTVAYQGYGRGLPQPGIESANHMATQGYMPQITYWLDLPVEEGLRRKYGTERGVDYMGSQTIEFYERVRAGYREIADRHPMRVRLVDARRSANALTDIITDDVIQTRSNLSVFLEADRDASAVQTAFGWVAHVSSEQSEALPLVQKD